MRQLLARHPDCRRPWPIPAFIQRPVGYGERPLAVDVFAGYFSQGMVGIADQKILLAVLHVRHYIEGSVVRTELGDRPALELCTGLKIAQGEVHNWCAGVASQEAGAMIVRYKGSNRCSGLVLAVRDVKYLYRVRLYIPFEREGNPAKRRREFLV